MASGDHDLDFLCAVVGFLKEALPQENLSGMNTTEEKSGFHQDQGEIVTLR